MEKAIRIAIEESASFVVAKTPPESYRIFPPAPPPKETSKTTSNPPPAKVQPEVTSASQSPVVTPKSLRVAKVVWAYVNLREGPGTNHRVIGNLKKGTSLKILEVKGDWLHVQLEGGTEAWVSKLATSEASGPDSSPPLPKPAPM